MGPFQLSFNPWLKPIVTPLLMSLWDAVWTHNFVW